MEPGLDQRKRSTFVSTAPPSTWTNRRPRRRDRARRTGLALMAVSLGLLGGVAVTRILAGHGAPSRVAATRVDAAPPRKAAKPVSVHTSDLVAPPFSWDYRWLETHPAKGIPANRARAAIMVELPSGHVLYSHNPHQRMAPASTAKLMTAMLAADNADPSTVIPVPAEATRVEPNVMGLGAGERVSIHDLLTGLLLNSGNDAAETLARSSTGNREDFIAAMNRRAQDMGLGDTQFANPSGLDDPAQFSSPHDLALMAAYLEQHYPLLAQIATTRQAAIPANADHKAFYPVNLNKLLWTYPGALGFKTGLTDAAGTCLVAGARRGDRTLLLVEMNDPLIFTDATAMLDYGFRRPG